MISHTFFTTTYELNPDEVIAKEMAVISQIKDSLKGCQNDASRQRVIAYLHSLYCS